MLDELKRQVFDANAMLPAHGLVILTWGNVSGIDREKGLMVIKPSGVEYGKLKPEDMAVVTLEDGIQIEGSLRPSSDTDTHLELYRRFPNIGGVVHTHSRWASTFAQAGMSIPVLGTTHADYFYGEIPCTRPMTAEEIIGCYELETGKIIAETFVEKDPDTVPAALVRSHGPFVWGKSPEDAVHNAVVLEALAEMAWQNLMMNREQTAMQSALLDRHYLRKHGPHAYYGQ